MITLPLWLFIVLCVFAGFSLIGVLSVIVMAVGALVLATFEKIRDEK